MGLLSESGTFFLFRGETYIVSRGSETYGKDTLCCRNTLYFFHWSTTYSLIFVAVYTYTLDLIKIHVVYEVAAKDTKNSSLKYPVLT